MPISKKLITLSLDDIVPYANNPRINDEAVDDVIASIEQCNNLDPIEIDEDNVILSGHTRLKALKKLGYKKTECIRYIGLTDDQKKKYRLLTNKTGEVATWDLPKLEIELEGLDFEGYDFEFDGIESAEQIETPAAVKEDNYEKEAPENPKSKLGDIFQLGKHRLMCGNSAEISDMDKLMNGVKADMAFTSPPYGVELDYNEYEDTFEETQSLIYKVLPQICRNTKDYIVLNWEDIVSGREINKSKQPSMFSWLPIYNSIMNSNKWFIWAERIWKKVHARCGGVWSANSNRPVSDWEYIFTWAKDNPAYNERANGSHFGIIDSNETSQGDVLSKHPGAFPVYVAAKVIETHSKPNSVVLDVFGGSGTTLIACEQTNRICYTMEIDPHYVDLIIDRWEQFTGQAAERVN